MLALVTQRRLHVSRVVSSRLGEGLLLFVDLDRTRANIALASLQVGRPAPDVLAQRLAQEAAVTRSSGGYVAIYAVGTTAVLVLLGDEGLDITRLHRESWSVVDNIEKLLA
jgi:hypothetical protein